MQEFDVIVIGQGYAGLVAAKLASERGLKTASVEGMYAGGLVMNINHLDPAPEGVEPVGAEVISTVAMANMDAGIAQVMAPVSALRQGGAGWIVETGEGPLTASDVIVASGARYRKLGVPGEAELFGRGVSECADCDGPMFGGMDTVIVGGGDSAYQEAVALAQFADKVTILMRGDGPRARPDLVEQVEADNKIEVRTGVRVTEVLGDDTGVTGVRLERTDGGTEELPCGGVFVFIGLEPVTDFLPGEVDRGGDGGVVTDAKGATGQPGLWALGAVREGFGGRLTDADTDAALLVSALA